MAEPNGLRRGPGGRGRRRLSAAGSHPSGSGRAQLSQAAVPEPMVQAERRGLPESSVGSHGTLPAPSLRRGRVGATARPSGQRETPGSQTSPKDRDSRAQRSPLTPLPPPLEFATLRRAATISACP